MGDQSEIDLRLWGKSKGLPGPYPLVCHLLDASAAAGMLWEQYLSDGLQKFLADGMGVDVEHARRLLMFWAGLHDIGKVMACFQMQDPAGFGAGEYPVPVGERQGHDYAAHVWLRLALVEKEFGEDAALLVAQLLGGHHGCFFRLDRRTAAVPLVLVPELGDGAWESQRRALVDVVYHLVGEPDPISDLDPAAAAVACGVVILADWLVSQADFLIPRLARVPKRGDRDSLERYFRAAVVDTPVLIREAGLGRLCLQSGSFADEHRLLPPRTPNALQRSVAENLPRLLTGAPGVLLIVAPMGFGKTETALTAARLCGETVGASGIFFALPTMATADPMYKRLSEYGSRRAVEPASLALLHSMAWLNSAYLPDGPDAEVVTGEDSNEAAAQRFMIAVVEWLLGAKRGLLAPWGTGTIDQVLLAGVRGRHNMLRMLGLAGKVLVVDEVHAYDAYMQQLLRRVLTWLGRLGVPVVLLSATLPQRVAQRLVESYLQGAGHRLDDFSFRYPGWLYADAHTGTIDVFDFSCPRTELAVGLRQVPQSPDGGLDRILVLRDVLEPLVTSADGCAGIICNTVSEAQQTYCDLKAWFAGVRASGGSPPSLTLLHSRFPADRREELTTSIVAAYGKDGDRPCGVVVATQVIEQSIDLDFDLIISDLAPVALLLQRAGRGHRHLRSRRAEWAQTPRLEVLMPMNTGQWPLSWPYVYPRALLRRTREVLLARTAGSAGNGVASTVPGGPVECTITIPDDVQELMEQVYDESFADGTMATDDIENLADEQVKRAVADMVVVPDPDDLDADLYELTDREIDDAMFTTRLGADSGRVVWCYSDGDDGRWLDRDHTIALPQHGPGPQGRLTKGQVKTVLAKSIPVPATWIAHPAPENAPPGTWDKNPYLRKILLLVERPDRPGRVQLGGRVCRLDNELGLT
ncbi:CRISPR-associated helicase Cas3' [Nocardia transvalensis]|uniref:CRISPR-associated helicase Cas3' n=1 Tax=Nocardia transvalensis TaxID=37333 RepID=UPI0018952EB3|nr:CRISPR-associated helicase Cas3' [Nocardia transvalensis]MBF6331869.1 CRISPR-associated helicase Cas3' [Nocardia transvalensis]